MAEIFGAVAAGIGIGSELIRLGRAIQKAIVKIKNSRRDIERLAHETITFVGIYKTFLRTCENDEHTYTTEASAIQLLITLAQKTCDGLSQLLESVEALQPQSKIKSQLEESLIARLVWFRSENRVKALRASLSVAKESISCFANLMQLSAFNAHIKELKEALNDRSKRRALEQQLGVPLEARIEKIELEISETAVIHRENKTTLNKAKQKTVVYHEKSKTSDDVPAPDELFELTEALDDYAREVLPPRQPSRRINSSASGSTSSRATSATEQRYQAASSVNTPRSRSQGVRIDDSSNTTSPASSTVSSRSSQRPNIRSTSVSEVSSTSENATQRDAGQRHVPGMTPAAGVFTERRGMRAEYYNDPDGNILSPPKSRTPGASLGERKSVRIGRHIMTVERTVFVLNNNDLPVNDYQIAEAFFRTVIKHKDKLDELDHVLASRHQMKTGEKYTGIPGWEITSRQIKCLSNDLMV